MHCIRIMRKNLDSDVIFDNNVFLKLFTNFNTTATEKKY